MSTHVYHRVNGRELHADVWLPNGAAPPPVVLWMHGGGWQEGDRTEVPWPLLTAQGWAVVSPEYRLTDVAPFPAQLEDVQAALAWLRAEGDALGVDATRIVIGGTSAGAQLALLAATQDDGLCGAVSVCGRTEFSIDWYSVVGADYPPEVLASLSAYLGGAPWQVRETALAASPYWHVSDAMPPVVLVHGEDDATVPINQARAFIAQLWHRGLAGTLIAVPMVGHEVYDILVGVAADPQDVRGQTVAFIQRCFAAARR